MDALTPARTVASSTGACPYVERGESHCASRFTLDRIDEAFTVCFGAYHGCEQFHRLRRADLAEREEPRRVERPIPAILTIAGQVDRARASRPIRPTGT